MKKITKNGGFTLVELLVVISIIGMLSSVILVTLNGARDKGVVGAGLKFDTYNYRAFGADAAVIYNFDDATNNKKDTSGNGFNISTSCSITNAIATSTVTPNNISGNSVFFPAVNSYCRYQITKLLPSPADLSNKGGISFWINPTNSNSGRIAYISGTNPSISICSTGFIAIDTGACGGTGIMGTEVVPLNKWTHIFISWNSSPSPLVQIYINGRLSSEDTTHTFSPNWVINSLLYIGFLVGGFTGHLDNFAIYTQSLQTAQVQKIYADGLAEHSLATVR